MARQVQAKDQIIDIETRKGISVPIFYMSRPEAKLTLVLLPGGSGGFGSLIEGKPSSRNFLVRSADMFADAGFNVVIVGRSTNTHNLGYGERITAEHIYDVRQVVSYAKLITNRSVWLVGTSRGSISATAVAINSEPSEVAGLVLLSSVVSAEKPGAVPTQDLASIRIPVLVIHHTKDACRICSPAGVESILHGLKNSPARELRLIDDGGSPSGPECGPLHHHGFIGTELETVELIANWINKASN